MFRGRVSLGNAAPAHKEVCALRTIPSRPCRARERLDPAAGRCRSGVERVGRWCQRLALLAAGAVPVASWKFSRGSRAFRIGAVSRPNTAFSTYSENTRALRSTVGIA